MKASRGQLPYIGPGGLPAWSFVALLMEFCCQRTTNAAAGHFIPKTQQEALWSRRSSGATQLHQKCRNASGCFRRGLGRIPEVWERCRTPWSRGVKRLACPEGARNTYPEGGKGPQAPMTPKGYVGVGGPGLQFFPPTPAQKNTFAPEARTDRRDEGRRPETRRSVQVTDAAREDLLFCEAEL